MGDHIGDDSHPVVKIYFAISPLFDRAFEFWHLAPFVVKWLKKSSSY